jgi:hypothetical protein
MSWRSNIGRNPDDKAYWEEVEKQYAEVKHYMKMWPDSLCMEAARNLAHHEFVYKKALEKVEAGEKTLEQALEEDYYPSTNQFEEH